MPLITGGLLSGHLVTGGMESGAAPASGQTFRRALRAKLLSLADLTAIVGSHIYPGEIPARHDFDRDGAALCYTVQKFPLRMMAMGGHVLSGSDGTINTRTILTAEGYDFSEVDEISVILFEHLDGIRNASDWGDGTIKIVSCLHGPEVDEPEPAVAGRPVLTYRIASEFWIRYRPSPLPDFS